MYGMGDIMMTKIKLYLCSAALGYNEYAYMIKLDGTTKTLPSGECVSDYVYVGGYVGDNTDYYSLGKVMTELEVCYISDVEVLSKTARLSIQWDVVWSTLTKEYLKSLDNPDSEFLKYKDDLVYFAKHGRFEWVIS